MPKDTFLNLPPEKQNLIIEIALQEFFTYGYEKASISRIVEQAGIAKGSFYQYFQGKADLFGLLMKQVGEKKIAYLSRLRAEAGDLSIYEMLHLFYQGALSFLKDNPKLAAVADRFMKSADSRLKEKILGCSIKQSNQFMEQLLTEALIKHEIRPDIDLSYTAHLITALSISMGDYIRDTAADIHSLDETLYNHLAAETIRILKEGLQD